MSLVSFTIDTEEKSKRFVRKLFSKGLIASAEIEDSGFTREYLMFGQMHIDTEKLRIQTTTSDDRVEDLINYVNSNSPNQYDYPVHDITVEPVSTGNAEYIKWIKA